MEAIGIASQMVFLSWLLEENSAYGCFKAPASSAIEVCFVGLGVWRLRARPPTWGSRCLSGLLLMWMTIRGLLEPAMLTLEYPRVPYVVLHRFAPT